MLTVKAALISTASAVKFWSFGQPTSNWLNGGTPDWRETKRLLGIDWSKLRKDDTTLPPLCKLTKFVTDMWMRCEWEVDVEIGYECMKELHNLHELNLEFAK